MMLSASTNIDPRTSFVTYPTGDREDPKSDTRLDDDRHPICHCPGSIGSSGNLANAQRGRAETALDDDLGNER